MHWMSELVGTWVDSDVRCTPTRFCYFTKNPRKEGP